MDRIIKFHPYTDVSRDVLKGRYWLGFTLDSLRESLRNNPKSEGGIQTASHFRTQETETTDHKKVLLINLTGASQIFNMRVSSFHAHGSEVRVPTKTDTWYLTDVMPEEFEYAFMLGKETGIINITPDGLIAAGTRLNFPAPAPAPAKNRRFEMR